jgi:integrase
MPRSYTRRSKGEGSVYETADGRVRGSLIVTHPDTGQAVRRVVSGRTRADVVRKLDKLKAEGSAGFPSGETTGAYLTHWIVAVKPRLRPATHREYVRHVTGYFAGLGPVKLTQLTPGHVERAMAALLERGLSPQTVRHARSSLRRALHDAQRDGLVTRNVAALARPPRLERPELRALTAAEAVRLLTETLDDPMGPLFAVALGSGLRRGELLGLRWSDVDVATGTLVVRRSVSRMADGTYAAGDPKTSRSRRTLNLAAVAIEGLRRQRIRQAEARLAAGSSWQNSADVIFTDAIGRPLDPTAVSNRFRGVSQRLGLGAHFHTLRHTAASLMLAGGVPMKVVSDALGHSSIAITADVYAHVTPELRREAAAALDKALGGAS